MFYCTRTSSIFFFSNAVGDAISCQTNAAGSAVDHCLISYLGGLGTSLCIMGYGTQHLHSQKENTELYNILKFGVNQANIRQDTAIQKLQILLRNV